MRRIKGQLNMVDYIRVDHFRGFEQYYAIPYGEETAMHGKWKKGPNEDLFLRMQEVFGKDASDLAGRSWHHHSSR